ALIIFTSIFNYLNSPIETEVEQVAVPVASAKVAERPQAGPDMAENTNDEAPSTRANADLVVAPEPLAVQGKPVDLPVAETALADDPVAIKLSELVGQSDDVVGEEKLAPAATEVAALEPVRVDTDPDKDAVAVPIASDISEPSDSGWLIETQGGLSASQVGRYGGVDALPPLVEGPAIAETNLSADDTLVKPLDADEEVDAILARMEAQAEKNIAGGSLDNADLADLGSTDTDLQLPSESTVPDLELNGPAAWEEAALNVPPSDGAMVAIIIDDLGWSARRTDMVSELSDNLTLALLADAADAPRQAGRARGAGHEVMIHMSMQASGGIEGEDNQLTVGMSEGELRQAVDNAVQRIGGAVGVNNHMGSLFTADEASMRIVLDQINSHGLVFIDSLTTPDSVAREVAVDLGMPYLRRDVFLDHDRNPEAIKKQLDELESVALERGWAVAIGHPYMETIDALAAWLPTLQRKGITLAPVSTLIRLENTDTQTAQRPDN
ncbi:MAG: divergent polysaccharide deacetylase family protein, partial [Pseudomonadota bacterium]